MTKERTEHNYLLILHFPFTVGVGVIRGQVDLPPY